MIRPIFSIILLVWAFGLLSSVYAKEKIFSSAILDQIILDENLDSFYSSFFVENFSQQINNGQELGFSDFINLVETNHPSIISAQLSREIASSKRLEAQGAFDPSINSQNFFNRFNSSSDIGQEQDAFTSNTSVDFLTGYGAKFGLGARLAAGDIKTPISPTGDTGEYFIRAQIPLLRNAVYNSQSVKEKTAKLNELIADYLLFRTKLQILDSASKAYWDWVANKRIFDIETNLLNLVNGQVSFVQTQADLGNMPQISVVEAQTELQKRQVKVNFALRSLQASSLDLSKFTWTSSGTPYSIPKFEQAPLLIPAPLPVDKDSISQAKINAIKQRPEFKALDLSRKISDLERKLAKNQMLPQLDAYINSGIETGDNSIGPTLEAGLNLSLPLRVRTAQGQKEQAELAIKQFNLQERQLIQNVFLEVEDSASALDTAYHRYLAAKQDYELSLRLEDGEKERFQLGDSTLFIVIRRQRATVEANVELVKTMAEYQKARVRFNLIQGELI